MTLVTKHAPIGHEQKQHFCEKGNGSRLWLPLGGMVERGVKF